MLNRREAEQLKALDVLKSHFFANITHEFRTPLSLIISPVDKMLLENRFDRPLLTTVQRNAGQLLRLINQLLDLSKLEGNNMPVSLVQGDVTEFVSQLVTQFQHSADQKGVVLTYRIETLPPHEVVFDADKWEKILTNLLANALKFTPQGGRVSLNVRPVLAGNELAGVQLELADSGIGIAPDVLPHIFDRFYQADMSGTRTYGGTGIGLSLVKELVDLLGGTTVGNQSACRWDHLPTHATGTDCSGDGQYAGDQRSCSLHRHGCSAGQGIGCARGKPTAIKRSRCPYPSADCGGQ